MSLYFTHSPRSPSGRICTKFGTPVGVADIITCNKFSVISQGVWILRGGGRKLPSAIDKASRR